MKIILYLFCNFISVFSLSVPYYYNPDIHNFGNIGIGGKIHAELGPLFTKIIDSIKNNNYHDIPNKDFTGPF